MNNLPHFPRRALLFAFWWVLSLTLIFVLCVINLLLFPRISILWSLSVILPLIFVGYRYKSVPYFVYRAWNKVDRAVISKLSRKILLVIIYMIITLVSMGGSRLRMAKPDSNESMWGPIPDVSDQSVILKQENGKEWLPPFMLWAKASGNLWIFFLLPFLFLLSIFQKHEIEAGPKDSNVYTLF